MHKAVLILLLIAVASPVWAEWSRMVEGLLGTAYIDHKTSRKNGQFVRVWGLSDMKPSESGMASVAFLREYDCKEERTRILATSVFSNQMGLGNLILKETVPEEWEYNQRSDFIPALVCHEWIEISQDLYVDPITIRRNQQFLTVWTLIDNMQRDSKGAVSIRVLHEYDCKRAKVRQRGMTSHSDLMAFGDVVYLALELQDKEWESIAGGGHKYVLTNFCN